MTAAELVADGQPSAQTYYQLAVFAYAAKQTRKGELRGRQVAVEPHRGSRAQLAAVKRPQVDQAKTRAAPSATGQLASRPRLPRLEL